MSMNRILDLLLAIAGIYMLYCGFTGRGSLYRNEYIKKGMEEKYRNLIRQFCRFGGLVAVAAGVLDYEKVSPLGQILYWVFTIFIVAVVVMIARMTEHSSAGR